MKVEIQQNLFKIVNLLDGSNEKQEVVKNLLSSLIESGKIDACSLFVHLHNLELESGLKPILEIIGLCMMMPKVFNLHVLTAALDKMLNQPQIPTLYMRTLLQSMGAFKLDRKLVNSFLLRLIQKQVWREAKLWEGFKRCCFVSLF